jgi:hypothetical protein
MKFAVTGLYYIEYCGERKIREPDVKKSANSIVINPGVVYM